MRAAAAIAATGVASAARHPLRSLVVVLCVVAVLVPYLVGLAVSRGLLDQAEDALERGADLVVTGRRFGREEALPLAALEVVRAVPGVEDAVPRIVGEVRLGRDRLPAVLVGVPADRLPPDTDIVEGDPFRPGVANELVVGSQLARRLGLAVGSLIPPFYENDEGERVSRVVGLFRSGVAVWEANLVLASLETAADIFAQKGLVTEVLVRCAPAYVEEVRVGILALGNLAPGDARGPLRPGVATREESRALLGRGLVHREGVFGLHFLLAFAVGVPLVLVASGIGLSERRREVGLLKATGWQTDEVLLSAGAESLLLAALGAALSVLLAWGWLAVLDGAGVAGLFLHGADSDLDVPFRLGGAPVLLAAALSFAVVATGTLVSTWRTASAAPREAMR